ncbi:coiled-coil domain-containing protein 151 [Parambassis ranga]|uniref:Coiled-coil domain-containing protein 151 n=1 Tax=Parambassis ranga TaxID=210632 RepID=A0A6P7IUZ9_9TELE|nr:coiled-coil domain-containing protein 151-like [Parambassis ranga]
MPFSAETVHPPLHDQVTQLQRKLQMLEGNRSASCEGSRLGQSILQLRQENKRLRGEVAKYSAGHKHVNTALLRTGVDKDASLNMPEKFSQEAIATLDQKTLLKIRRLNAQKHTTQTQQSYFSQLKMESQRLKPGGSRGAADAQKEEEAAMLLRVAENKLGKTQFKNKEAESITANYLKLISHFQNESFTYSGQMDHLEAEFLKLTEELHKLQAMNTKVQRSKDAVKAELQQLEELLHKKRKERERTIAAYRKKVVDDQAQADKLDRKTQRTVMQPDDLSSEAQHSTTVMAVEEEKVISTFEEVYRHIKEITGVTDTQEVVERFTSCKKTHQDLDQLTEENQEVLLNLKGQKEHLNRQFEDMKYSGEAKHSSEQQILVEWEHQLQAQQQRCDGAKESLESLVKFFTTVQAGVEHLAHKLQHISLTDDIVPEVCPDSHEFVIELMTQCEMKLQLLHSELEGQDLATISKELEEDEFHIRIEKNLPDYNIRVKLPDDQTLDAFKDEEESEEDEAEVISREALKRQSQLIIDSKSKKKPWKKKGKL